jgi:hypothetical protein
MFSAPSHGRVVPSALGTLPSIPTLRVVRLPDRREYATAMATLVTRNQFNVTPQGVVHKPTEAAFIPSPGDPLLGTMRLGQLVNQQPNGREYRVEDVQRIMGELWEEFVASNPEIFNTNSASS